MMNTTKESFEMLLDRPGYPWQLVEGDGVTWVILRLKKKLEYKEIQLLHDVFLDRFSWSVIEKSPERRCYRGSISLTACYSTGDVFKEEEGLPENAEDEDYCRELFIDGIKSGHKMQNTPDNDNMASSFPSLLLDEIKSCGERGSGKESWSIELPWRAWLKGRGEVSKPVITKINLSQVGLNTLLLEILIKLEVKETVTADDLKNKKYALSTKKETVYHLKDECIKEILGIVQERAFFAGYADIPEKSLTVSNQLKTTLVFVCDAAGGERLLTASHICKEENRFTDVNSLELAPVCYCQYTQHVKATVVDNSRVLGVFQCLWGVKQELPSEEERDIVISRLADTSPANKPPVLLERRRPGERWMKKPRANRVNKPEQKLVLIIKK